MPLRVRTTKGKTNRRGSGNRCRGGSLLTERVGQPPIAILGRDCKKIPRYERVRDGFLGRLRVRFAPHGRMLTRGLTDAMEGVDRANVFHIRLDRSMYMQLHPKGIESKSRSHRVGVLAWMLGAFP